MYATAENKVKYLPAAKGIEPSSPRSKFGERLVSLEKEKLVFERLASPGICSIGDFFATNTILLMD